MKKYQIRNVSDREIYDSYMGILRISPNPLSPSNDKMIDDPTSHLNSMLSIDELNGTQTQMKIQLSDSDGNELPIVFIPKSRYTNVGLYVSGSTFVSEELPIINIVTKIKDEASLYVSNTFKSYSTIYLDNTDYITSEKDLNDNLSDIRYSPLQVLSKSGIYENLVLYPVESPHDSNYFNDKNKLNLIDYSTSVDRIKSREESLLNKKPKWYDDNIPTHMDEDGYETSERVRVGDYYEEYYDSIKKEKRWRKSGGRYVTTYNNDGETIPVLYTRDYVLGHYEGHNTNVNEGIKNKWIGTNSSIHDRSDINQVTKLSWLRFDDLVWDVVDNALRGDLRHTKGRYTKLGEGEADEVSTALFANGTSTLCEESSINDILAKTAPIVAQGVQPGLIIYNAMSFQRYMFHLTRQISSNMEYQFETYVIDDKNQYKNKGDNWTIKIEGEEDKWSDFNELGEKIKNYKNQKLISSAPQGALNSIQSLCKNFVFCDGRDIDYSNYPNLNLSNDKLFELNGILPKNYTSKDSNDIEDRDYIIKERGWNDSNSENYQIYHFIKKSPDLYSLYESSPRFLRGLNWDVGKYNDIEVDKDEKGVKYTNKEKPVDFSVGSEYKYTSQLSNNKTIVNINNTQITLDEDGAYVDERTVGEEQSNVVKDINQVGLYFNNNDNMVRKNDHYHASFSSESGMNSTEDVKGESQNLSQCVNYVSGRKRGGTNYSCDHSTVLNHDFIYNYSGDKSKNWINYCFNKNNINKYNGYAPIPNGGLFLFNCQLYNPISTSEFIGTSKEVEKEIKDGNFVYYDGENKEHKVLPIKSPLEFSNLFLEALKKNDILKDIFKDVKIGDILATNFTFLDKTKIGYKITNYVKNNNIGDENAYNAEMVEVFKEVFKEHIKEKEIRRIQMVKMNESEGRIPAAAKGGPMYASHVTWSRTERRNIKKKRRKAYSFIWKGVGSYNIGVNNNALLSRSELEGTKYKARCDEDYKYRCLTSIPYQNSSKLGAGDPSLDLEDDYYNKNSVTTQQSDIVYEGVTYGGVDITKDITIETTEIDEATGEEIIIDKVIKSKIIRDAPTPSYVNLLPLIRI